MLPTSKQSRQARPEKKKLAERLRLERIKIDPEIRAKLQEKKRLKYLNKNRLGKVTPIDEKGPQQQKIMEKKSTEISNDQNEKKGSIKLNELEEEDKEKDESDRSITFEYHRRPSSRHSSNSLAKQTPRTPSLEDNISVASNLLIIPASENRKNINDNTERRVSLTSDQNQFRNIERHSHPIPVAEITNPTTRRTLKEAMTQSSHDNSNNDSSWKILLRKIKHQIEKELQIKNNKIQELKRINRIYRKRLQMLKKYKTKAKLIDRFISHYTREEESD